MAVATGLSVDLNIWKVINRKYQARKKQ